MKKRYILDGVLMLVEGVLMFFAAFTENKFFLYGAMVLFVISGVVKIASWRKAKKG